MYGKRQTKPCPMCTAWIDGMNGVAQHVEQNIDFAIAYARLASVYANTGQRDLATGAAQKAFDLRDRVSEREKFYITAYAYTLVTREREKYPEPRTI